MKGVAQLSSLHRTGHVQGVAGDFHQSKPARMRLEEIQERRAKQKVWEEIIDGHCSNDVAQAIMSNQFTVREVSSRLRDQGWKETTREISIDEEAEE